jgi:hypothetical protein
LLVPFLCVIISARDANLRNLRRIQVVRHS